jgi:2-polyprenyl-6-methoxyphenol hydroxylase-like FAD-dependent oxidoreductase
MSPFGGDGANLAMQDAADLALALEGHEDWRAVVQSTEIAMFARAEAAAAPSAKYSPRTAWLTSFRF